MPGRRGADVVVDASLCRRCQTEEPAITIRLEPLCKGCFTKYVSSKVVKRMETFRVRHSQPGRERRLLLPVSFGYGSVTLLHVLSQHLAGQVAKTGRTGFRLHVLHVADIGSDRSTLYEKLQDSYPEHEYSTRQLDEIASLEDIVKLSDRSAQELKTHREHECHGDDAQILEQTLTSLQSVTSKEDMVQILRRRLIVHSAKEKGCEAILWGDSTTRLAERTLAETAKGRGFSLSRAITDGESPHGHAFYYPLRELLSKEISAFATLAEPCLDDLVIKKDPKPPVATKNTSIDDLMKQYFESVEREYPSIVANVVRTTGKLNAHQLDGFEQHCELCDMPLDGQAPEKSRLCYGCIRTLQPAAR